MSVTSQEKMSLLMESPVKKPSLVSSIYGKISSLLYAYPHYPEGTKVYKRIFQDLFEKLPSYTRFTIWCHTDQRIQNDLKEAIEGANLTYKFGEIENNDQVRCQVVLKEPTKDFTVWAQDPFLVVQDVGGENGSECYLMEPVKFHERGGEDFADEIVSLTACKNFKTPLYYHGGNTLIGDDFVLMGNSDFRLTVESMKNEHQIDKPIEFAHALYKNFLDHERDFFFVTSLAPEHEKALNIKPSELNEKVALQMKALDQPLPHIDLYITLAGKDKDGKNIVLVGDAVTLHESDKFLMGFAAQQFNDTATRLQDAGFKVIRNPLPAVKGNRGGLFDYFAFYNNCLVEILGPDQKKVWLPSYGSGKRPEFKKFDDANEKVWKELGFEVTMLTDFHDLSELQGAVHCISKDLSR